MTIEYFNGLGVMGFGLSDEISIAAAKQLQRKFHYAVSSNTNEVVGIVLPDCTATAGCRGCARLKLQGRAITALGFGLRKNLGACEGRGAPLRTHT